MALPEYIIADIVKHWLYELSKIEMYFLDLESKNPGSRTDMGSEGSSLFQGDTLFLPPQREWALFSLGGKD